MWEPLLTKDASVKPAPALATAWEHNEDSTVWTFHLRDDVDWCDVNGEVKSHLTSKDFLVGLEWVLNALKNEAFNTSMPSETVVGDTEYYDLTKDKGDAAADMTYEDMLAAGVGVEAPDDYTLVFTCKNPCPYFDTVAAYNSFYPASEDLIKELGIDGFRACDYSTMWYNGPYLIEEYIQQNTKSFIPNPNYYAANDCTRFEHHTITMIPDLSMGLQLYENGEVDNIDLTASNLTTITYDPNYRANLWKNKEDAIAQMKAPLPLVDILKVSDEELPLLTGTTDCESGTAQLAQNGIRLIFVTLGANGVFYRFGDNTGHVAGVPCKVGDTNGAGDTFFGAALSKLCKEELDTLTVDKLEGILAFANKAASITTSRHGAIPAMPTLAEVEG